MNRPFLQGLGAFFLWGVLPLYLDQIQTFAAIEITNYRIVSSVIILAIIFRFNPFDLSFFKELKVSKERNNILLSTFLMGINWYVFVYAIEIRQLKEASLGYFVSPLLSVFIGWLFLKETIPKYKKIALTFATIGTSIQIIATGTLPWIAITLALTFSVYGLLRKKSSIPSLKALFIETIFLTPFAIIFNFMFGFDPVLMSQATTSEWLFLIFSGIITTTPLFLFKESASKLPLSTVGILQYISPSMQLCIALLVFKETLAQSRIIALLFIILASLIIVIHNLKNKKA